MCRLLGHAEHGIDLGPGPVRAAGRPASFKELIVDCVPLGELGDRSWALELGGLQVFGAVPVMSLGEFLSSQKIGPISLVGA